MYCKMIEEYVTALNEGTVPVIQNAWECVLENECEAAIAQAVSTYTEQLNSKFSDSTVAFNKEDLDHALNNAKDSALSNLGGINHIKDRDPEIYEKYYDQLLQFIEKKEKQICEKNKIIAEK